MLTAEAFEHRLDERGPHVAEQVLVVLPLKDAVEGHAPAAGDGDGLRVLDGERALGGRERAVGRADADEDADVLRLDVRLVLALGGWSAGGATEGAARRAERAEAGGELLDESGRL